MKTTLNKIKAQSPCTDSWKKLLDHLGKTEADDTEVSIKEILDLLGVADACWALQCVEDTPENQKNIRLMCADFAESVLPVYEKQYPEDTRIRDCINAARSYANGEITEEELAAAGGAAWAAARDARAAARDAGDAARDAGDAAWAAAWAAARDAAWAAAWAAGDAARGAEKEKQRNIMLKYI